MRIRSVLTLLTAGLLASPLACALPQPVRTATGLVSGVSLPRGVTAFEGIPFAAPPVGKLRWQPPQPATAWQGVRKADHFGPSCMQSISTHRIGPWSKEFLTQSQPSEDCLYLNVWTPARTAGQKLPVMVWIYGGGFTSGSTDLGIYNGAHLAQKGVVLVSVSYRVGPLGFLAYPGLTQESPHHSSGNYGLLDQIAGLRWVRRNIAAFGGDPGNVTIFGQSAGGFSVDLLLQSPLARGLFARAIIMSGPPSLQMSRLSGDHSLAGAEQAGQQYAASLGAHTLAGLRALPAARLLEGKSPTGFGPIRDGWVLPSGNRPLAPVPVMNGMVADDIGIGDYGFGPPPNNTVAAWQNTAEKRYGAEAKQFLTLYPVTAGQNVAAERKASARDRARVALLQWAAAQQKRSGRVYTYYFDHVLPWPQHPEFGAFHSSEIPYVFHNLDKLNRPWTAVDHKLANELSSYWVNFAKTGNPNGSGLPEWPAYHPGADTTMELGHQMAPMPVAGSGQQKFWTTQEAHRSGS